MRPGGAAARRPGRRSGPCDLGEGPPGKSGAGCPGNLGPSRGRGRRAGLGAGVLEAGEPSRAAEMGRGAAGGAARQRRGCGPQHPLPSAPSQWGSQLNRSPPPPAWASLSRSFPAGSRGRVPWLVRGALPASSPFWGPSRLSPRPLCRGRAGRGGAALPWGMGRPFQPAACPGAAAAGLLGRCKRATPGECGGTKLLPDPAPLRTRTSCRSLSWFPPAPGDAQS